ncbi:GNAT family N-acetyltransferase [Thermogemmatispora onikobensis]|uniref:GNAT family N-acetyltransferase n=1 Tax=Thermogemmatispora onikobensis TaxID=732234 RepID=UPI000852D1C9|nr:GNAT family N-acetyltransferase [Thermogemmatispora onikobensis]
MFTLRRYRPADQEAVERLHVTLLKETGAYLGRGSWDDDVYAIEEHYLNNGGEFLIGECDGKIVAMGALKRTDAERAEIKRMRVLPEYQGRGYGQRLLEALEARARTLGYRLLHLDTSVLQTAAQRLYTKNGFREVGRSFYQQGQPSGEGESRPLEKILYEKPLI